MGESRHHAELVAKIIVWAQDRHAECDGMCILLDSAGSPPEKRPRPIGGYVPDVSIQTVPASFVIIGEAKTLNDLTTRHTRAQLHAYLEYLTMQADPLLVLATPWVGLGLARGLLRQLKRSAKAEDVPTHFLIG